MEAFSYFTFNWYSAQLKSKSNLNKNLQFSAAVDMLVFVLSQKAVVSDLKLMQMDSR